MFIGKPSSHFETTSYHVGCLRRGRQQRRMFRRVFREGPLPIRRCSSCSAAKRTTALSPLSSTATLSAKLACGVGVGPNIGDPTQPPSTDRRNSKTSFVQVRSPLLGSVIPTSFLNSPSSNGLYVQPNTCPLSKRIQKAFAGRAFGSRARRGSCSSGAPGPTLQGFTGFNQHKCQEQRCQLEVPQLGRAPSPQLGCVNIDRRNCWPSSALVRMQKAHEAYT